LEVEVYEDDSAYAIWNLIDGALTASLNTIVLFDAF